MPSVEFDPLTSSASLIVYIDYKSPYAYLAVDPTIAMADELGIEVDWRPFTLDIPSYLGSAKLNKEGKVVEQNRSAGQWTAVKHAYHDVRRYGSLRGAIVRGTVKIWDSSLAGIGMLWAKAQGKAILLSYIHRVYEPFWKRELDIEDVAVIERILGEAGAQTRGFREYASGEGRALHDMIQTRAFDAGIFGVPTYLVDGERFFGREHLPRIRWILTGRKGAPPPDTAYEAPTVERASADLVAKRKLGVAIDFKSPYSCLAIAPTIAMAAELGITIDWLPMIVNRSEIAAPGAGDRASRHRRYRADYIEHDLHRYLADRGITTAELNRPVDSTLAALGLLWAKRQGPLQTQAYVQRVFDRYWRDSADLADARFVEASLAETGTPVVGFASFAQGEGRDELARINTDIHEMGSFDVPTFIYDDDVYIGRQHLPLLRARLQQA
jgi:2-hydroxychromene-2-carboxylate isomerase